MAAASARAMHGLQGIRSRRMNLYLCKTAFAQLCSEAIQHRDVETGGILIGYETSDAVVITNATGPGPQAQHRRYRIELDLTYIRECTSRANDAGRQYQGSWHKHPVRREPRPSFTDRRLLRRTTRSKNYRLTTAIMIITTTTPEHIDDLRAFMCRREDRRILRVNPILCPDQIGRAHV